MPWAAPMRPMSRRLPGASVAKGLLGGRGFGRSFGGRSSVGRGLGLRLGALGRLLARQGLLGIVSRIALEQASGIEEAQHAIGRLGADAQPMLGTLGENAHALAGVGE